MITNNSDKLFLISLTLVNIGKNLIGNNYNPLLILDGTSNTLALVTIFHLIIEIHSSGMYTKWWIRQSAVLIPRSYRKKNFRRKKCFDKNDVKNQFKYCLENITIRWSLSWIIVSFYPLNILEGVISLCHKVGHLLCTQTCVSVCVRVPTFFHFQAFHFHRLSYRWPTLQSIHHVTISRVKGRVS